MAIMLFRQLPMAIPILVVLLVGGIEPYVQEALFSFTPVGEGGENFKPRLASSYSIDQNVINITLKEGIKWSDGSDITAQDVLTQLPNVGR